MADVTTTNALIITMNGEDMQFEPELYDITMQTPDSEILEKMEGVLQERNLSLKDGTDYSFGVRKAENSGNIYIFPKVEAG